MGRTCQASLHCVRHLILSQDKCGQPESDGTTDTDLGVALRFPRAGEVALTRPLRLPHDWLDLLHSLPSEEWHCA